MKKAKKPPLAKVRLPGQAMSSGGAGVGKRPKPPPIHWVHSGWGSKPVAGPAPGKVRLPGQVMGGGGAGVPVAHRAKHHAKPRKWSPDEDVAMCSARAVAESLRLALGVAVTDEDVLALYARTQDDPDAGASILATLETVRRFGLAGFAPARFACAESPHDARALTPPLILGTGDFLGHPHAVLAEEDRWWSWGEPYDWDEWPSAVIDEAWAVQW